MGSLAHTSARGQQAVPSAMSQQPPSNSTPVALQSETLSKQKPTCSLNRACYVCQVQEPHGVRSCSQTRSNPSCTTIACFERNVQHGQSVAVPEATPAARQLRALNGMCNMDNQWLFGNEWLRTSSCRRGQAAAEPSTAAGAYSADQLRAALGGMPRKHL
eukprot:316295-Amphidinium_carterae.1